MNSKYLIYVDILGFEALSEKIGKERNIESRKVREDFISVIKERLEEIKEKDIILETIPFEGDSWILVTHTIDKVFMSISEILNHRTGYREFEKIPLEIVIGIGKYDRWAKFNRDHFICEDETIKWLKSGIINYYHKWYKSQYKQPLKSTFIVLTESVYNTLDPLDKIKCVKIIYRNNKEFITFFTIDAERVQQRGKVFEFLNKINEENSKWYKRIDEVYVAPLNYKNIKDLLEKHKIIFITAPAGYGKTYTAVRLMWEYYNQGYEPVWVRGGEPSERSVVRQRLEKIVGELRSNCIIYFEDPFGKRRYEGRENLERDIGMIIDTIKQAENVYVIITCREEIFKKFEEEALLKGLYNFRERLSYNYSKRVEILLKWAAEEDCKWLTNDKLKTFILYQMKNKNILPTPLSIKGFVISTAKANIEKKDELEKKLKEKSEDILKEFAKEIKNMRKDKIIFLLFPFISNYFKVEFVKKMYEKLVKELNIKNALKFDKVLDWFRDDKVKIVGEYINFSHPLYGDSLEYLLDGNNYFSEQVKEIYSKLLIKLSENVDRENAADVVKSVVRHFNKISQKARAILFKFCEDSKTSGAVAWAILDYFDELPKKIRNKLLRKLSKKSEAVRGVIWTVATHFNELPMDIKKLLFIFLLKSDTRRDVIRAIEHNSERFPQFVRNIINVIIFVIKKESESPFRCHLFVSTSMLPFDKKIEIEKTLNEGKIPRILEKKFREEGISENFREVFILKGEKNEWWVVDKRYLYMLRFKIFEEENKGLFVHHDYWKLK